MDYLRRWLGTNGVEGSFAGACVGGDDVEGGWCWEVRDGRLQGLSVSDALLIATRMRVLGGGLRLGGWGFGRATVSCG